MSAYKATQVRFCHQTWQLTSLVSKIEVSETGVDIIVEQTPFHPVSHIWPDHPADKGHLTISGRKVELVDCLVGAIELETGTLFVDKAIPVKRDTAGWVFVVVHRIPAMPEADLNDLVNVGDMIELKVDKAYQQSLSRGHSAGHIAYLALNKVLAQSYWRKDPDRKDPLGHPDFNSYAQETSFITPDKCIDIYRLGKTLRKRGLNSANVLRELADIECKINHQLQSWIEFGGKVTMRCDGSRLTDSRYWECQLEVDLHASTPCGGTHIDQLSDFGAVEVALSLTEEQNIEMQTYVKAIDRI